MRITDLLNFQDDILTDRVHVVWCRFGRTYAGYDVIST